MERPVEKIETEDRTSEGLSILIIDKMDESDLLKPELELLGHRLQVAFSYNGALEKVRNNIFDLIIMDMDLPEGDWFSTIVWIREIYENIHIITMTGNNSREIEELAREQRVIYYIIKPIDIKEMRSVIHHISKKKTGVI